MERSERSLQLYEVLLERGYPQEFCALIANELRTDFTATRMLGYLSHYSYLPEGEVVDEMLAILSDRDRWIEKKRMENTQAKWNQIMLEGFGNEDEEES